MPDIRGALRLEFPSRLDMVDFVQLLSDQIGRAIDLDADATHWVGVSVRESVVNAIRHGNAEDETKRVVVEFRLEPSDALAELCVRVVDQGEGFDPAEVGDCLAPENILKASGRGIFLMRSFMDALTLHRAPGGGTEVLMVKKIG